jgi:hypothetical protein
MDYPVGVDVVDAEDELAEDRARGLLTQAPLLTQDVPQILLFGIREDKVMEDFILEILLHAQNILVMESAVGFNFVSNLLEV